MRLPGHYQSIWTSRSHITIYRVQPVSVRASGRYLLEMKFAGKTSSMEHVSVYDLRLAGEKRIPTTAIETLCVLLKGTWVVNNWVINLVIETTGTYEIFDA